jgi:serine O-acetyltransferase
MLDNVRADLQLARQMNAGPGWFNQHVRMWFQPGTIAVLNHRCSHWLLHRCPLVLRCLLLPLYVPFSCVAHLITGVHIASDCEIGPGLVIHTTQAVFVGAKKIGCHCVLQTGVLIASGVQSIGDNVFFGAGAKVVERARIGNNVVVAPNSLVVTDVPDNTTVLGVPARIRLPRLTSTWYVLGHPDRDNNAQVEDGEAALSERI